MKIRSITFKPPEPKLKVHKLVTVYLSDKHSEIIVAPYFKDPEVGIKYEQEGCEVIALNSSLEEIGLTIKRNFEKFDLKRKEGGNGNKSEWPAYKASKEKSIRGFEQNYRRISIRGLTETNSSLRIETVLNLPIEIELTSTISAHCEPSDLGKRVLKIFRSEIIERK